MTATCFICGRPAQSVRFGADAPTCGFHRLSSLAGEAKRVHVLAGRLEPDAMHARRLTAFHGSERAELILAGRDPETNADIAAWRALGASAEVW
jgi:hypothetical protein